MELAIFNYIVMWLIGPLMVRMTRRGHDIPCVIILSITTYYIAIIADFGLLIDLALAIGVFVNIREMYTTFIFQFSYILKH